LVGRNYIEFIPLVMSVKQLLDPVSPAATDKKTEIRLDIFDETKERASQIYARPTFWIELTLRC